MKNLGILLSGRGSNFEAIARHVLAGSIPARIPAVISNREHAPGLERARSLGFEAHVILSQGKSREAYDLELASVLQEREVDIVCLAGFMRVLGQGFIRAFPGRILNIHPSLLPAFPGLEAQRQALDYGVKFTGCTVHVVDEGVDTGTILRQAVVPVLDGDTVEMLSGRILTEEHRIYPETIGLMAEDRIWIEGRRTIISA